MQITFGEEKVRAAAQAEEIPPFLVYRVEMYLEPGYAQRKQKQVDPTRTRRASQTEYAFHKSWYELQDLREEDDIDWTDDIPDLKRTLAIKWEQEPGLAGRCNVLKEERIDAEDGQTLYLHTPFSQGEFRELMKPPKF